ncbi:hypothetical protein C8R47DRAFT_108365 [Mycena vitilis]|nr:hypothetical protein C8R47DRAFT_108365 [Mycena vitilis]
MNWDRLSLSTITFSSRRLELHLNSVNKSGLFSESGAGALLQPLPSCSDVSNSGYRRTFPDVISSVQTASTDPWAQCISHSYPGYIVIGVAAVVTVLGGVLYWRSRVLRRIPRRSLPVRQAVKKPRLHDAYLDMTSDSSWESWHGIKPLSIQQHPTLPMQSAKYSFHDPTLVPGLSVVTLIVAMPSSSRDNGPADTLPYLEIGLTDVEVVEVDGNIS